MEPHSEELLLVRAFGILHQTSRRRYFFIRPDWKSSLENKSRNAIVKTQKNK